MNSLCRTSGKTVIVVVFVAVLLVCHSMLGKLSFPLGGVGSPSVFSDYRTQRPGVVHKITVVDLPQPYATASVDHGPREMVPRPAKAWPQAPTGFKVEQYTTGLENPREIRTAPNGDLFVAESAPGRVKVFRGI